MPASLTDFFQRAAEDLCLRLPHSPCQSDARIPAFRPHPDLSASQALMQLPQHPPGGPRTCPPAYAQPELMPQPPGLAQAPCQHCPPCRHSAGARVTADPSASDHPAPAQQDAHAQQQQQELAKHSAGPSFPPVQAMPARPDLPAPGCRKQAPCSDFSSLLARWHPPAACITTGAPSLRLPAAAAAHSPSVPSTPAERPGSQAGSGLTSRPATPAGHARPQGSPLVVRWAALSHRP